MSNFQNSLKYCIFIIFISFFSTTNIYAQPAGFADQTFLGGFQQAVGLTFDDNGRMYVFEKGGKVWIVENGVKLPNPLIDLSEEVGNWRDFGMLGFALDPDFLTNGYIYMLYLVDRHHLLHFGTPNYNPNTDEYFNATIGRITRYKATQSSNFTEVDYGSRFVLLGDNITNGFPNLHQSHGTGSLVFGTDGTLMASLGDGASYSSVDQGSASETYFQQAIDDGIIPASHNIGAYRVQLMDSYNGKLLRIDPQTGNGVPTNPFYQSGNPGSVQSKIWSLGLRNPFRMTIKPESGSHDETDGDPGIFYIGDVGWGGREELNVVTTSGQNFGWPKYEGMTNQPGYNNATYEPSSHDLAKIDWRTGTARANVNGTIYNVGSSQVPGPSFTGNCSVGGVWYTHNDFPPEYQNTYFHADYGGDWIRIFRFDENNNPTAVENFKSNADKIVFVGTDPVFGGIYYIGGANGNSNNTTNVIHKISYTGGALPPIAVADACTNFGTSPLTVEFYGSQSYDLDGDPLTYLWTFGDGQTSTAANPTHTFTTSNNNPTSFNVQLTVSDTDGFSDQKGLVISLNNTAPSVLSTSVDNINSFDPVNGLNINLSAVVADAEHATNSLDFQWIAELHHNNHYHSEAPINSQTATTELSPIGCDDATYFYRIKLILTDPAGLYTIYEKDIYPNCGGLDQTISMSSISNKVIASPDFNVTANSSSGLPVIIHIIEGPATVSGNTISLIGEPGYVWVRAIQSGNGTYNPAAAEDRFFYVATQTPSNQTITFPAIADKETTDPPFTISASSSSGWPVTDLSIVSGPATISGNTITLTGATGTVTVRAKSPVNAYFFAAADVDQSFEVTQGGGTGEYCASAGQQPWVQWIENVNFGTIDNTSFKEQYGDFTNLSTNVNQGGAYTINLTSAFSWSTYDEYWRVWIDYNNDGIFQEPGEIAFSQIANAPPLGTNSFTTTGTINIPSNAVTASTRMRVSMKNGAFASPCETFALGEVEDYSVNISSGNGGVLSINCPANITVQAVQGQSTAPASWSAATANSTCPTGSVSVNQTAGPNSGSNFPIGQTTITYTATDGCGNTQTCSFTVTVQSNNANLTISCPSNITVQAAQGQTTASVTWNAATANSTCSTGTVNVSQTNGPTSGSNFPIGTTTITYMATDGCSNVETCSFTVTVTSGGGPGNYCSAIGTQPWVEWIANVTFGTINNTSFKEQYGDFTSQVTSVATGSNVNIDLTSGFSWFGYEEHWRVWIDYNQNGTFEEPAEIAFSQIAATPPNGTTTFTTSGNISIPTNALTGTTRMRIAMKNGAYASPCESFQFGEVEDYSVNITQGGTGPFDQTITFPAIPNKLTTDDPFGLFATASSGLPVTYSVLAGPASVVGNMVTLNGTAGTVSIQASQAGNATYNPAPDFTRTFVVNLPNVDPPVVNITQPTNGSTLSSNTVIVNYALSGDLTGIDHMLLTLDNQAGIDIHNLNGSYTLSNVADGSHTLTLQLTDDNHNPLTNPGATAQVSFTVSTGTPGSYCDSKGDFPWHDWISNVTFGSLNNDSGKNSYSDFTALSTTISTGVNTNISLTNTFSWETYDEYWTVWIDYNQNGIFEEITETAFSQSTTAPSLGTPTQTVNGVVNIPASAKNGNTRMRIAMKRGAFASPCETFGFGEVEDYTINITGGTGIVSSSQAFLDFYAFKDDRQVKMNWVTNTEFKNDYFIVERSADAIHYEELTRMESLENGNAPIYYQFTDETPMFGDNFYRLKQVYFDGTFVYSNQDYLNFDIDLEALTFFPNPSDGEIYVNLSKYSGKSCTLQIFDNLGQSMMNREIGKIPSDVFLLDLSRYESGIYFIMIQVEGTKRFSNKIIINKL